jgi:hypothetical protein
MTSEVSSQDSPSYPPTRVYLSQKKNLTKIQVASAQPGSLKSSGQAYDQVSPRLNHWIVWIGGIVRLTVSLVGQVVDSDSQCLPIE